MTKNKGGSVPQVECECLSSKSQFTTEILGGFGGFKNII